MHFFKRKHEILKIITDSTDSSLMLLYEYIQRGDLLLKIISPPPKKRRKKTQNYTVLARLLTFSKQLLYCSFFYLICVVLKKSKFEKKNV